jgi:hypothetical protein
MSVQPAAPDNGPGKQRRDPRTHLARPVYVQSAEPASEPFEEVRTMRDFSPGGLYFFTERPSYFVGMNLHVIPAFGVLNLEYSAQVIRVERLPAGDYGVALRLLRVSPGTAAPATAAKSAFEAFALVDAHRHLPAPTK